MFYLCLQKCCTFSWARLKVTTETFTDETKRRSVKTPDAREKNFMSRTQFTKIFREVYVFRTPTRPKEVTHRPHKVDSN